MAKTKVNFEDLVGELMREMEYQKIVAFDNLQIDGELIKIEKLCSIWIMERGMICYYPGEIHAMITVSPPSTPKGKIHRHINSTYPEGLKHVEVDLKKKIETLKGKTYKSITTRLGGKFPLKFPDFSYQPPMVLDVSKYKPETIATLKKMLKDIKF